MLKKFGGDNKYKGDNKMDEMRDFLEEMLVEYDIATQEEIDLVCNINGYSLETMEDILYARTGLRSIEQFCDEYNIDNPFEEEDEE